MRIITVAGRQVHIGGRKRPLPRKRRYLGKYMASGLVLPTAPPVVDYTVAGSPPSPVVGLSDILANDTLGDCTSAGVFHLLEAVNAAAAHPMSPTPVAADAIKFYSLSTGYDPSNPATDQGGDEVTVLTKLATLGVDGNGAHQIMGFFDVDMTNIPLARSIAWLFGGIYFGAELPTAYTQIAGPGFRWGVGTPNPDDGHCFVAPGATDDGWPVITWGMKGTFDFDASTELCTEANGGAAYAILTNEIVNTVENLCPAGIDWATLMADFQAEGGQIIPGGAASAVS